MATASVLARPERLPVTRDRIGAAALAILDASRDEGALTMRALGAALGVKAPSLYAHVTGIDDVIGLVHERINGTIDLSVADHPDPFEGLRRFARAYREAYARHRVATSAIVLRAINTDHALAVYEAAARCMDRAGVPADRIMPCLAMLDALVLGSAIEPFADGFVDPARSYRRDFPVLAAALARSRRRHLDDEGFEIGLAAFLDAVRGQAA